MRKICQTVYLINELSDAAKDSAREWYRNVAMNDAWYDSVYEDASIIADILGIDMRTRKVSYRDGSTRYDGINITFSGFSSQGDGASFNGHYRYAKGAAKEIREYAPMDTVLHRIADSLQALQRKHFYSLNAEVTHSGHYSHEFCTDIDVGMSDDRYGNYQYPSIDVANEVAVLLRDFMRWIYRALEKKHDFQTSDEAVDENILSQSFEFTEEGSRSVVIGNQHE